MNTNRTKYSFQHKVTQKVIEYLKELKEIKQIPEEKITMFALDRKDFLENKIKYYLVPVKQQLTIPEKFLDKEYVSYLVENEEVVEHLLESNNAPKKEVKNLGWQK